MLTTNQRVVVAMVDGFGLDYFAASDMPNLRHMRMNGLFREINCVFPSVTNVNNVSIATRHWPQAHGITGNSYFDPETGASRYMNAAGMIRKPTVFADARAAGIGTALFTSKRKTTELFQGVELSVAGEVPPPALVERLGEPGGIYSREINYWLWWAAIDTLVHRPEIGFVYIHTTDYPMHTWAPEAPESKEHLATLDRLLGEAAAAAPDAAFFITADHGMNAKTRCWDLTRVCEGAGVPVRFALSPERDYYVQHHRNFGGCAYVWLHDPDDYDMVVQVIGNLNGVEAIIPGAEAARRFHLVPERVGDMVVLADKVTTFGDMEAPFEELGPNYRNHGSTYEMDIPLVIHNFRGALPPAGTFTHNKDLLTPLYGTVETA